MIHCTHNLQEPNKPRTLCAVVREDEMHQVAPESGQGLLDYTWKNGNRVAARAISGQVYGYEAHTAPDGV